MPKSDSILGIVDDLICPLDSIYSNGFGKAVAKTAEVATADATTRFLTKRILSFMSFSFLDIKEIIPKIPS